MNWQMKKATYILLLLVISCGTPDSDVRNTYYVEKRLSFYDPYNEAFTFDQWIRDPKNIKVIHETIKMYGYKKLFPSDDLTSDNCSYTAIHDLVTKPCKDIIDSLIITYPFFESAPKYYKEFWLRRQKEKNDTIVYEVLKEIKTELFTQQKQQIEAHLVNDTILNLIRIKVERPETDAQALKNFEYLKSIGLHGSAYNLLFERYSYYEIKWDNENLKNGLRRDTVNCCPLPVIDDDTK